MLSLHGAGIGRGIAIGKAYVIKSNQIVVPKFSLTEEEVRTELQRLKNAVRATEKYYLDSRENLPQDAKPESTAFIDAHLLILQDPLLVDEANTIVQQQLVNAEYALQQQANNLINVFDQMQNHYLRSRKKDVQEITNRLLRNLLCITSHNLEDINAENLSGRIIVGNDLSPADVIYIKVNKARAFVSDLGSQISHSSIIARNLQLPAVVGLHNSSRHIFENDLLVIDGKRGVVLVDPEVSVSREYKRLQKQIRHRDVLSNNLIRRSCRTVDGEKVTLLANAESPRDVALIKQVKASAIGLYRTEYLFMNRNDIPSEKEQFNTYKRIVTRLERPVTIRTLDVGGDKQPDFEYPQKKLGQSPLGLRAVRLCLNNIELFKPQIKAILRASAFGKISILLPMISTIDEVTQTRELIRSTMQELQKNKIKFDNRIKIGGMIEVPAAALMADQFAHQLDFLSIGTNDLIQYTLAIDRVDDAVNYLYDPIHPAVLKLIKIVIEAGRRANIPVSLCGEMAGNTHYTKLLLGLGLRSLSMDASYLLDVKKTILESNTRKIKRHLNAVIQATNSSIARDKLTQLNKLT